jgi:hypothetical protein
MHAGRDRDLVLKSALQGTGLENGQIQRINEGFQNDIYSSCLLKGYQSEKELHSDTENKSRFS